MNSYNSMLMGMGSYTPPTEDDWYGHSSGSGSGDSGSSGGGWMNTVNSILDNVVKPGADIYNTLKNSANANQSTVYVPQNQTQQQGMPTALKVAAGAAVVTGVAFVLYQVFKPKKKS